MKCKDVEQLILLDLYDEVSADDRDKLRHHLDHCGSCREQVKENQQLFHLLDLEEDEELSPRWDECWNKIEQQVAIKEQKSWIIPAIPRWSMAAAASLVLLVIGFFLGRNISPSAQPDTGAQMQASNRHEQMIINNYLEDIRPMMVDLANYKPPQKEKNGGPVEKEIIKNMLMQTRLLKQYFSNRLDPSINQLLDEMEMILIDLNNVRPGDKRSLQSIQGIIKTKGIPLKIKMFEQKSNEVTTI